MKRWSAFTILFAMVLAACAPILPAPRATSSSGSAGSGGSGEATAVVITAEVSTVIASTVGPPGTVGPFPTSEPPTPIPPLPSSTFSPTELKCKILDQFPKFFFCDPDFYPIARDDELSLALGRFTEIQANPEEFQAILNHSGLSGATTFTDDQKLQIYRDYKKLNAIHFELAGDKYQFQIQTGSEGGQGALITGVIDGNGAIEIQKQEPSFPTCPICLAAGTLIDTPRGAIAVENLHVGDAVWTMNEAGERVVGKILRLGNVHVPATHQVVHLRLSDGRELWASLGHPTADGRVLGNLQVGDSLDGVQIVLMERVHYQGSATYDLLPSGGTGFYWANGILMGSTLKKP